MTRRWGIFQEACIVVFLTLLTQIGGVVWLFAKAVTKARPLAALSPIPRRITFVIVATLTYAITTAFVVPPMAHWAGRDRLPCDRHHDGPLRPANLLTCVLNRGYVRPEAIEALDELASKMDDQFPGTHITVLEGGFPFITGFPFLPHLSHRDGLKIDLAFLYVDRQTSEPVPSGSPSFLGYFVVEPPAAGEVRPCVGKMRPLRWSFGWIEPNHRRWRLDERRTRLLVSILASDPRVGRLFLEPHLVSRLEVAGPKVRFQGCDAARHDDHIHVEFLAP